MTYTVETLHPGLVNGKVVRTGLSRKEMLAARRAVEILGGCWSIEVYCERPTIKNEEA